MTKYQLLITSLCLFTPVCGGWVFADDSTDDIVGCNPELYTCYEKRVAESCQKPGLPWNKQPDFGNTSIAPYPLFRKIEADNTVTEMNNYEVKNSGFSANTNLASIGGFDGFRIAEISRQLYRKNMNAIFSCAVIASRQDKLDRLEKAIQNKAGSSDISNSLKKEKKRYESIMVSMNCNQNTDGNTTDKIVDRLLSSGMKEYCSYTYYLDYLDANIRQNFSEASVIDASVGSTSMNGQSRNTQEAQKKFASYSAILDSERARANETLPKAVLAYQELDRTYITHILLVIIFDDYLKLRGNLSTYLSQVSQTFEKAYNAQDDNQR